MISEYCVLKDDEIFLKETELKKYIPLDPLFYLGLLKYRVGSPVDHWTTSTIRRPFWKGADIK